MKTHILNPLLYNALKTRFGDVKIASPGERFVAHPMRDPYKPGVWVEECLHAGEYYCVCCPYCKDQRHRLWVNHLWNVRDEKTGRITGRNLIICYNEACDLSQFHKELLFFQKGAIKLGPVHVHGTDVEIFKPTTMPGLCIPLNQLPADHPAIVYLTRKRLNPYGQPVPHDPDQLYREWGVCYCERAEENAGYASEFVEKRLVLPVFRAGIQVGWQSRAIDDFSTPKYYTKPGTPKRHMLVNSDRARAYPLGVVVEGFFDLFAIGPPGVAALGKHLSYWQMLQLTQCFSQGMVCFLLDPDAADQTRKNIEALRASFRYGCFGVTLPGGWDAGACTTSQIWTVIRSEGARQGFQVP